MAKKILRMKTAAQRINSGVSTLYDWQNPNSPRYIPSFPKRIKIGHAASGILEEALDAYINERQKMQGDQE